MSPPFDDDPPWPDGMSKVRPIRPVKPDVPALPVEKRKPIDWPALSGKEPPLRRWAQKGWIGFGHTTLLVGAGGIGKTLLAQQIGSCLALGRPYIEDAPEPLKVLMWACEDDHDELWRRQVAIAQWLQVGLEAFSPNLVIVPRHGLENALVSTEFGKLMFTPLLDELRQQALDIGAQVVMLDNVAQLYGGNENDRHSVTMFLNTLDGILASLAILLLAHPSRAAGSEMSGSGAWENVARTRLFLGAKLPGEKESEEPEAEHVRYLARRKANYSSKDWRKLNYANGVLVPEPPEITGGIVSAIRTENAERILLAGFTRLVDMGLQPSSGHTGPRYLPRLLLEYKLDQGASKKDLASALRAMMVSGIFTETKVGHRGDNRNPIYGLKCTN